MAGPTRLGRLLRSAFGAGLLGIAVVLALELTLRLGADAPRGRFAGWFPGRLGLYPESASLPMPGAVPWRIRTNRWGLRGREVELGKPPGVTRVAMIGDSVTDGFGVDDGDTFPRRTEESLRSLGVEAEVLNAASGGRTINTELAILRETVLPFRPDIVVLTFVTNDIDTLRFIDETGLLGATLRDRSWRRALLRALVVDTALGEALYDAYLRVRAPNYRSEATPRSDTESDHRPDRSLIPGGAEFAANAREFRRRFAEGDAQLLVEPMSPAMEVQFARYLRAFDAFVALARSAGIRPVFVYFPAYPQIYEPHASLAIQDRLHRHSAVLGVPFLDLTPALRSRPGVVLHQAPVDYHPNAEGNRVMGRALGEFLVGASVVTPGAGKRPPVS